VSSGRNDSFSDVPSRLVSRLIAYGYRYGEVPLAKLGLMKEKVKFSRIRENDYTIRPPVLVSFIWYWVGACLPHCCSWDPWTMVAGVRKRFAMRPPKANKKVIRGFQRFVKKWIRKNLTPVRFDADTSVETWLEKTDYPEWRKKELRDCWEKCLAMGGIYAVPKFRKCKSFMKDECYVEWKFARGINARSDEFKCAVGPIFRLIEEVVFKRAEFIKKIPVAERPQYIKDRLWSLGGTYVATDYSSFEALFTKEVQNSCEMQLYRYMSSEVADGKEWMSLVHSTMTGMNTCQYKWFTVKLPATRMSGEMCTSLGNGFTNLMLMLYMCKRAGCKDVVGVVEGDDGLFRMRGKPPSVEDFAEIGMVIKADIHTSLTTASFCGLVFDIEDQVNVVDIRKVLAGFGWTSAKYVEARASKLEHLMRSKALSLLYQYPGCPVLQAFGRHILRLTSKYSLRQSVQVAMRNANVYERQRLREMAEALERRKWELPFREVPMNTRFLVEQLYGVSVESQLALEKHFNEVQEICPINLDAFLHPHWSWRDYYDQYVLQWDGPLRRPPVKWVERANTVSPLDPSLDCEASPQSR